MQRGLSSHSGHSYLPVHAYPRIRGYLRRHVVLTRTHLYLPVHTWSCTVLDMDLDDIRNALTEWSRNAARRDMLVKLAHGAGISIREIGQLSGISRTTIYKILEGGGE